MNTSTKTKDSDLAILLKTEASNIKNLKENDYIDGSLITREGRVAYSMHSPG